jgi:orotate phosphoribosyltransferase
MTQAMAISPEAKKVIISAALEKEIFALRPNEPFTWASGIKSPIYNDNRRHLSFIKNRTLINDALLELAQKNNLSFDAVLGTSTAGIPWGAQFARSIQKPFFILVAGEPYEFSEFYKKSFAVKGTSEQQLIVNCPWGIAPGVVAANDLGVGLLYQRESPKKHGKQNLIEGTFSPGEEVIGAYFKPINEKTGEEVPHVPLFRPAELGEKTGLVVSSLSEEVVSVQKIDLEGKHVLVIEDLVSTAGSIFKEVSRVRELGGTVTDCITNFTYDFPEATERFGKEHVTMHAVFSYNDLLPVALEKGFVTEKDLETLKAWRENPHSWGV